MPGQAGYADEDDAPSLPRFAGGEPVEEDEQDVSNWHQQEPPAPPPPVATQTSAQPAFASGNATSFNAGSFSQGSQRVDGEQPSDAAQFVSMHAVNVKERFMSFTADARLGAQVMRVRTGVDAKVQAMRDSRHVAKFLSQVGIGQSAAAAGIPCEPPAGAQGEVLDLFQEDPALRQRIVDFHEAQRHLDELLPALQEYQRHRWGLAEAERKLGAVLKESGVKQQGPFGQALQDSGTMHLQASARRMEAYENEEKYVTSVMLTHSDKASQDCKEAVQAYEACRKELRLLHDARRKSQSMKQQLQESGANRVDSKLAPTVEANFQKTDEDEKEKLQATTREASVKLAMFKAKHNLDYATAISYHMKNLSKEEHDVAGFVQNVAEPIAAFTEAAAQADLAMDA